MEHRSWNPMISRGAGSACSGNTSASWSEVDGTQVMESHDLPLADALIDGAAAGGRRAHIPRACVAGSEAFPDDYGFARTGEKCS